MLTAVSFEWVYLLSSIGFILGLLGLGSLSSAVKSNKLSMLAMAVAMGTVFLVALPDRVGVVLFVAALGGGLGAYIARAVPMTSLPELMAAFHSLVGLAAVCLSLSVFLCPMIVNLTDFIPALSLFEIGLGAGVGGLTFTGSVVAFLKLRGKASKGLCVRMFGQPVLRYGIIAALLVCVGLFVNAPSYELLWTVVGISFLVGLALVMPIGGADMPVVVSMLNAYSGWAAAGIGFTFDNFLLVVVGALVGASGTFLSYVMCQGMNRPFLQVIFGRTATAQSVQGTGVKAFKRGSAEDAAFLLKNAQSVLVVPGYGMAVAGAQHAVKEMVEELKKAGAKVRFAIHPVAGRMPGHMNVLLAEANIPPEDVLELEEVNADFPDTDVVLVIGANDITNPSARTDQESPLYGMPILNVDKASTILFVKRSMGVGYSGVDNPLFYEDKTYMLLDDGKKMVEGIVKAIAA